jgi:carbonic anhydrase/acetyltransferase-like protein (isoleucine patch superfamily)
MFELDGVSPDFKGQGPAFVAEDALVIGRVTLGEDSSTWFGAVLRGDNERIYIGAGTNIQEHSVLHTDPGYPLIIADGCTIGHRAMLHGCTIGENSLIGIGAIVLNGAVIGKNSLVGAGALITEGKIFPDGSLIIGSPARVARSLDEQAIQALRLSAQHYVENGKRFASGLTKVSS